MIRLSEFKIEMRGGMCFRWPEEKKSEQIPLARCSLRRGDSEFQFIVETVIDAIDEDEARKLGRERCMIAADLFSFLIGEGSNQNQANLDLTQIGIWPLMPVSEFKTYEKSYAIDCIIANPSPLSKEQLDAINSAEKAINEFEDESNNLLRSIRWRALGQQDAGEKIDKYIKLFISLEVLVVKENKIAPILSNLYPEADIGKLREIVNDLAEVRGVIQHAGARRQDEIEGLKKRSKELDFDVCLDQLERLLIDLLRDKLTLPPKRLLSRYLI